MTQLKGATVACFACFAIDNSETCLGEVAGLPNGFTPTVKNSLVQHLQGKRNTFRGAYICTCTVPMQSIYASNRRLQIYALFWTSHSHNMHFEVIGSTTLAAGKWSKTVAANSCSAWLQLLNSHSGNSAVPTALSWHRQNMWHSTTCSTHRNSRSDPHGIFYSGLLQISLQLLLDSTNLTLLLRHLAPPSLATPGTPASTATSATLNPMHVSHGDTAWTTTTPMRSPLCLKVAQGGLTTASKARVKIPTLRRTFTISHLAIRRDHLNGGRYALPRHGEHKAIRLVRHRVHGSPTSSAHVRTVLRKPLRIVDARASTPPSAMDGFNSH